MHEVLGEVLLARQPLMDARLEVVAYEWLYRDGLGNAPDVTGDGERATARVLIDGLLGVDGALRAGDEDAFVNVPRSLLLHGTLLELPSDGLVLELGRDVTDDAATREAILRHRRAGFRFALDGLTPGDDRLSLLDAVDLAKVDVLATGPSAATGFVAALAARGVGVVAEKVEDPSEFDPLVAAGARLVQGFFFTRPRVVRSIRPLGLGPNHLALLRETTSDEVDLDEVERLIRSDLTLTDRFLRLVDVVTGWRNVDSVGHGLVMLGERAVRHWTTLLVLSGVVEDASPELLTLASVRARYCEVLEEGRRGGRRLEAFSVGMFSVLGADGVLSDAVVRSLPLSAEVAAALRGEPGYMRDLIRMQVAVEAGDWDALVALGRRWELSPRQLASAHVEALDWSNTLRNAAPV